MDVHNPTPNRRISSRDTKLALLQDVDKLKKKLRHEENVHRALERAFTRPLGSLPRLPPYLPPYILELLAEVAVLEEEVVRLEEQIVQFRKELYQEAVNISSSKQNVETSIDSSDVGEMKTRTQDEPQNVAQPEPELVKSSSNSAIEEERGKENQSSINSMKSKQQSPNQKAQTVRTPTKRLSIGRKTPEKPPKSQLNCRPNNQEILDAKSLPHQDDRCFGDDNPNALSERILKCLISIFLRKITSRMRLSLENFPALYTQEGVGELQLKDPYCIYPEFNRRDIGLYKNLFSVDACLINQSRTSNSVFLVRRLKVLLEKLASVKLQKLTHLEKLAFWINIYNSCMMNAFLEHGIPETPDTVVALIRKATINVGGHLLNALTIEHFILRLPYHSKYLISKEAKKDELIARSVFGLELSEPLVTFALSCGSWSSPAVRIYTATQVESELEAAKRDYLQAAVGVTRDKKLIIPKLLDWYLLDYAKDLESLVEWVCLELPDELLKDAMDCLRRSKDRPISQVLYIMPNLFSFRYLLHR